MVRFFLAGLAVLETQRIPRLKFLRQSSSIISSGVLLNPEGGGSLFQAPLANRIL
jgi:hypothetical protein